MYAQRIKVQSASTEQVCTSKWNGSTCEHHLNCQVINHAMWLTGIQPGTQSQEPGKQNANVLLVYDG